MPENFARKPKPVKKLGTLAVPIRTYILIRSYAESHDMTMGEATSLMVDLAVIELGRRAGVFDDTKETTTKPKQK